MDEMGGWMTFSMDLSLRRICRVPGGCAIRARDPYPSASGSGIDRPSVAVVPLPAPSAASEATLADPPVPLCGFLPVKLTDVSAIPEGFHHRLLASGYNLIVNQN